MYIAMVGDNKPGDFSDLNLALFNLLEEAQGAIQRAYDKLNEGCGNEPEKLDWNKTRDADSHITYWETEFGGLWFHVREIQVVADPQTFNFL